MLRRRALPSPAEKYVRDADWLLHEAFCLDAEAERFRFKLKMFQI